MARKKSVTLTQDDVIYAVVGALGSMAANKVITKALESQPENTRATIAKAVPAMKVLGGGYFAMKKGTDRKMRFVGLGVAATGAVELGNKFAPQYFSISGSADLYDMLGTSQDLLELPIAPDVPLETDFVEDSLLGTEEYAMSDMI